MIATPGEAAIPATYTMALYNDELSVRRSSHGGTEVSPDAEVSIPRLEAGGFVSVREKPTLQLNLVGSADIVANSTATA